MGYINTREEPHARSLLVLTIATVKIAEKWRGDQNDFHYAPVRIGRVPLKSPSWKNVHYVIKSSKRHDVLAFYCYLCHVR